MGGNLFSCHSGGGRRANKLHNGNRLSREDLNFIYQYSASTPISPSLSGGAPVSPLRNNGHNQKIPVPVLTSTPVILPENGAAIRLAEGPLCVDITPAGYTTTTSHSKISLNENLYDKVQPSSAPSSPTVRRKAPPKPPRMRSVIQVDDDNKGVVLKVDDHLYVNITELSPTHSMRSSMPPLSPQTPVRSSMEDITSMFSENDSIYADGRSTLSRTHMTSSMKSNSSKIIMRGKVYDMILQTRGYLLQELDPEDILKHLSEQGAISERTEVEIRKCRSKDAMCEILLDVVMSKGHKEFTIFCDCLRQVGGLGHLADLLEVLDTLIETVTETHHGFRRGITPSYIESKCHLCVAEADDEDSGNNTPNFDIDISYFDNEGQKMRSVKEIAKLKQQESYKLASTVKSLSVEQLNRFIPVMSVSFYNQCLNNEGLTTLADLLSKYNCIRELSIVKNHVGEEGMDQLGKALQKNHGLTKLDIRLNTIGDEGATSLQKALNENRTLKILNVTSTGLTGLGCNKLVRGLHKTTCLSELDVGFNDLRNEGCETFALVLANNCSLRNLRMRDNNIGKDGAILIFQSLRKNSRLTALDMSSNKLGDESVKCLSEVLLVNRGLRELNLENCAISSGGCPVLSRALKTNTALRILDLSMNQLCDSGATALSDGLKYNKTLTTLSMNMCSIGNIGFIPLLDSLMFNITLVTLKLCYNHIGEIPLQSPPAGKQRHRHVPVMGTQDIHVRSNELRVPPDRLDKPLLNLQEKYAELLSCNPELKILLWGNKLEDHWKGGIPETPKSIASCNF